MIVSYDKIKFFYIKPGTGAALCGNLDNCRPEFFYNLLCVHYLVSKLRFSISVVNERLNSAKLPNFKFSVLKFKCGNFDLHLSSTFFILSIISSALNVLVLLLYSSTPNPK